MSSLIEAIPCRDPSKRHPGTRFRITAETPNARACYVLAHGAGAGMDHPFATAVAGELAKRHIATLALSVSCYMERQSRRLIRSTADGAGDCPHRNCCGAQMVAKTSTHSLRQVIRRVVMTSQAQAKAPLENVRGLAFLGFPLHPTGRSLRMIARQHLFDVKIPMLFLQGTRDIAGVTRRTSNRSVKSRWQACNAQIACGRRSFFSRAKRGPVGTTRRFSARLLDAFF